MQKTNCNYQYSLHFLGNIIGLGIICGFLIIAFILQLVLGELACPLCLLQRIAYVAVGTAMCMNLKFKPKSSHYGMMLLASLFGFMAAIRQVFLHILPGDMGYGTPILGVYNYSWNALIFFIITFVVGIALLLDKGLNSTDIILESSSCKFRCLAKYLAKLLMIVFIIIIGLNIFSVFLECGLYVCPDDPVEYLMLK